MSPLSGAKILPDDESFVQCENGARNSSFFFENNERKTSPFHQLLVPTEGKLLYCILSLVTIINVNSYFYFT